jgi:hypothetical protein
MQLVASGTTAFFPIIDAASTSAATVTTAARTNLDPEMTTDLKTTVAPIHGNVINNINKYFDVNVNTNFDSDFNVDNNNGNNNNYSNKIKYRVY